MGNKNYNNKAQVIVKTNKVNTFIIFLSLFICTNLPLQAELIDKNAAQRTKNLYKNLKSIADKSLLFGMHDATGYGVGWRGDETRSDVNDVCGDYPAVFEWDARLLFNTSDSVVNSLRNKIQFVYNSGGINVMSWHQKDPVNHAVYAKELDYKVVPSILPGGKYHQFYKNKLDSIGQFAKSLKGSHGELIPLIFRPYHEQNGDWFWWGKAHRTEEEYIELWRFTVNYIKDTLDVHNFIYAFSPDGHQYNKKKEYLIDYPGDNYVDILGLDFYFPNGSKKMINEFQKKCIHIVEYAENKEKVAALTETGSKKNFNIAALQIDNWFTRCLLAPIKNDPKARKIVYALVWRNASKTHHHAPYPGHKSVTDFMKFYNDPFTYFLDDIDNIYESDFE